MIRSGKVKRMALTGVLIAGIALVPLITGITGGVYMNSGDAGAQNTLLPPIDTWVPSATATASFAMGWAWGSDAWFGGVSGVIRTRVGLSGGTTLNPTYPDNIGDHAQTVRVDYDPTRVTYEELLEVFFTGHDPTFQKPSDARSVIFYHNDEQRALAIATKAYYETLWGKTVYTEIVPASELYMGYPDNIDHHKYFLRAYPDILDILQAIYPDDYDLISSTSAARVNSYLAQVVTLAELQAELDSLGLSTASGGELQDIASYLEGVPPPPGAPGTTGDNGGCFIATAAHNPSDPNVQVLRDFRDGYLLKNPTGRALVAAYYKLAPPVAEFIDGHPALKPVVRTALLPAVALSSVSLSTTPTQKAAIASGVLLTLALLGVWLRSRRVRGKISQQE